MTARTLVAKLAIALLVLSGCSFDELVDFAGDTNESLTGSSDEGIRAGGESGREVDHEVDAQREVGLTFADGKTDAERLNHAENAVKSRPLDPATLYNRLMARTMYGDVPIAERQDELAALRYLLDTQYPDPAVRAQKELELKLTSLVRWVELPRDDMDSDQLDTLATMEHVFCSNHQEYKDAHGNSIEGAFLLGAVSTSAANC